MALTTKQSRFADEYLIDGNATEAAKRAGYSQRTATQIGHTLLKDVRIAEAVAAGQAARAARTRVDADWVIERLRRIADASVMDFATIQPDGSAVVDLRHATADQLYAIGELTSDEFMDGAGRDARPVKSTKLKVKDTLKALELIGKSLSMWTEKVDVNHAGGITVVFSGDDADL